MDNSEGYDEVEEVEKIIVLLLGVGESNLKEIFMQKELFILSNIKESLKSLFNFKAHYQGPYSETIHSLLESPVYLDESFNLVGTNIYLTEQGNKEFSNLAHNKEYREIIPILKFIRNIYEKLSEDELLFLIYATYPKYLEFSNKSKFLFEKENKEKILNNLLKRGLITEERYSELI